LRFDRTLLSGWCLRQLGLGDVVQQRPQLRGAPATERRLELLLRLRPAGAGCAQPRRPGLVKRTILLRRSTSPGTISIRPSRSSGMRGPIHHQTRRRGHQPAMGEYELRPNRDNEFFYQE